MKIFLSYRRDDSHDITDRIGEHLAEAFGRDNVFEDVDSIPLGQDFRSVLSERLGQCDAVLVVIGPKWLTTCAPGAPERRLDDPHDFVRSEVAAALARQIPVIPLLVGGAVMPREDELPDALKPLAYRNGMPVRPDPDFEHDLGRLIATLRELKPSEGGSGLEAILGLPATNALPRWAPIAAALGTLAVILGVGLPLVWRRHAGNGANQQQPAPARVPPSVAVPPGSTSPVPVASLPGKAGPVETTPGPARAGETDAADSKAYKSALERLLGPRKGPGVIRLWLMDLGPLGPNDLRGVAEGADAIGAEVKLVTLMDSENVRRWKVAFEEAARAVDNHCPILNAKPDDFRGAAPAAVKSGRVPLDPVDAVVILGRRSPKIEPGPWSRALAERIIWACEHGRDVYVTSSSTAWPKDWSDSPDHSAIAAAAHKTSRIVVPRGAGASIDFADFLKAVKHRTPLPNSVH
jgi:hypothetical protein